MASILIADSCDLGRAYTREVIQYDGHSVLEADDFSSMVGKMLSTPFDVLVLDPALVGASHDAFRRLLAGPLAQVPQLFLVSEEGLERLLPLARDLGAAGAFLKGVDAVAMLRSIEHTAGVRPTGFEESGDQDGGLRWDTWSKPSAPRRPWQRLTKA